jgi:SAP domain-containing new25
MQQNAFSLARRTEGDSVERPVFSRKLSADEFRRWYWLKSELVEACRLLHVSPTGSKPELAERIVASLSGAAIPAATPRRTRGAMPTRFTLETRIGEGWRCNPALGAFLRAHVGRGFRFNAAVRAFVHTQVGQPVSAIIACYRASIAPGATKPALPPQLEYNRHMQSYAREHPGATRAEVLAAWRARRARPSG